MTDFFLGAVMLSLRHRIIIPLVSGIAFILLLYLIFLYYSIGDKLWLFYNTDAIYLPYLYQDLILRDGKLSDWVFSSTPYFFPDALIYFILAAFSHNLRVAILLYAVVQFTLYYWLIIAIGKKILKQPRELSLLHFSVLTSLFLLSLGYLQQETLMMGLISQSHFGTALMFLLGLLLILNTFSSNSLWNYVFLFIVCFLTVFSDILYLTQFFVPAVITLFFMIFVSTDDKTKRIYIKNMLVISFSCASSYIIYRSKLLPIHLDSYATYIQRTDWFEIIAAIKKIIFNFWIFYQTNAIVFICFCLYIVLTLHYLIRNIFNKTNPAETNGPFIFTIVFLFISILVGFLSLLFLDNILMATRYINLRHCIPFIIFPVFLGIPLYLAMYTRLGELLSKYYIYIMICMISYAYFFTPKGSLSNIINFYPENTACLDSYAHKYHLNNGISYHFWETRANNFLSKQHLNIINHWFDDHSELIPRLYFNTLHDVKNKDFNFMIVNEKDFMNPDIGSTLQQIKKNLGPPLFEFTCPSWDNKINTIYVYQNGRLNKHWNDTLYAKLLLKNNL